MPTRSSLCLHNTPQLLDCPASKLTPLSNVDMDEMAAQTLRYIDTLNDHASAVRGHPERAAVYQHILDEQQVLPPGTRWSSLDHLGQNKLQYKMEDIILCPATAVDEYVPCQNVGFSDNWDPSHLKSCFAANTLLLLQHHILNGLPPDQSRRIDNKINKLRSILSCSTSESITLIQQ